VPEACRRVRAALRNKRRQAAGFTGAHPLIANVRNGWKADVTEYSSNRLKAEVVAMRDIAPFVTILMIIIGWFWTLRAGAAIQRYDTEVTPQRKRIAMGNTVVSAIPLAFAAWQVWARS
jgi:hypothetical protein